MLLLSKPKTQSESYQNNEKSFHGINQTFAFSHYASFRSSFESNKKEAELITLYDIAKKIESQLMINMKKWEIDSGKSKFLQSEIYIVRVLGRGQELRTRAVERSFFSRIQSFRTLLEDLCPNSDHSFQNNEKPRIIFCLHWNFYF